MPPPRGRGTAQTAATVESTAAVPRQPASRSSGAHHQTRLRPVDNATDNGLMRTTGERADEPPVVRGKAAGTLTAEELSALRASHDRTVVDVGAGDGRAVYRLAPAPRRSRLARRDRRAGQRRRARRQRRPRLLVGTAAFGP